MPSLPTSGAMSIGTLNGFFGGSGTSLSNFYRGGGRVPTTRTSTVTIREPSSGDLYQGGYEWRVNSFESQVFWGGNGTGLGNETTYYTSVTLSGITYFRGSFRADISDGEGVLQWQEYGIFRTYPSTVTTAINTGVPSSGTISLSNFYGAENS
jgi:hypothetical protein